MLLSMVKQRNKEFGVIVRGVGREIYKVYPDGHEELMRLGQFDGLDDGAFKDLAAASQRSGGLQHSLCGLRWTPLSRTDPGARWFPSSRLRCCLRTLPSNPQPANCPGCRSPNIRILTSNLRV